MSRPWRWLLTISAVTGTNAWFRQSVHLIRGFSQMPRTHSLRHTGAYPALPVFGFSHLRGKTSSRPRKSERKTVILSSLDNAVVVVAFCADFVDAVDGALSRSCSSCSR